jgi:hypothetical protein
VLLCDGVESRSAKSKESSRYIVRIYKVGHAMCRVRRNFGTLRMFGGGVFKRGRLVCLAGLSGASRNGLGSSLPHETSVA